MTKRTILVGLTAAFALSLAACEPAKTSTAEQNARQVENNQQRLQNVQPAPVLDHSLERENLIERLKRLNAQNMAGYIYLISQGTVIASYPVKGKATSLNAYLMAAEKLIRDGGSTGGGNITIEQPDYDGAYGKNADGIFFFTADGVYVEWAGDYLFSDQPLKLNTEPRLERQVP